MPQQWRRAGKRKETGRNPIYHPKKNDSFMSRHPPSPQEFFVFGTRTLSMVEDEQRKTSDSFGLLWHKAIVVLICGEQE
jgi:hypothetical protein